MVKAIFDFKTNLEMGWKLLGDIALDIYTAIMDTVHVLPLTA